MEEHSFLNDAFLNFTEASKSLEQIYQKLQERVHYLTNELAKKNAELETALHETAEVKDYLKGILENLREAILALDQNNNITMFNKAAERMFNIEEQQALGKQLKDIGIKFNGKGPDTVITVNKKRYSVFLSKSDIVDEEGAKRGHVILIQDITRLKELEAQQERNKRLIAMGEMAATIVHEIRSPLCSIELYATMLEQDLKDSPQCDLASGISTGIRSLNNILTNMLLFAKPQKPNLRRYPVNTLIEESLSLLMPMIETRGIILKRSININTTVPVDMSLIKQAIMNILINAIQVSEEGDIIEIKTRQEDNNAVIQISDNGDGIETENLERIFDPFFSTKEKGTGLGLAISTKIMQAHGGAINVKSELGKGSCFELFLPC
ncbi:signal transduction histidine-protein kinase AtoS [Candidatus Magnetoovum chiemensis]|nr:signal transduction histidine-protein kinase AtoS [Candidatus Magnetoovum chiemensis]